MWECGERGSRTLRLTTQRLLIQRISASPSLNPVSRECYGLTCTAFSKFLLLQDLFDNIYLPTFVVFNVQRLFSIGGVFESGVFGVAAEVQLLTPPCCHGGTLTLSATEVEDIPCEIALAVY